MKLFLSIVVFFSLLTFTSLQADETWYGYCRAEVSGTNYCSGIRLRDSGFDGFCREFAESVNAYKWYKQYSTSVSWLQNDQQSKCDEILSGDDSYDCQVVTYCENNGSPTSSISPINFQVKANDHASAISQCLTYAKNIYYSLFKNNSKDNCFTRAEAAKN